MSADAVDVLVAGGGPVGLAVAIDAALAGLSVVVAEPRAGVLDKACGEGLMPGALAALSRLGVEVPGRPIAGFRYSDAARSVEHRLAGPPGRGVRRRTLHAALAARVADLGVPVRPVAVGDLMQDASGVTAVGVRARYLVAADGLHSPVRRRVGLDRPSGRAKRYGLRRHFAAAPWTDLVEVHWSPDAELYVTPVDDHSVGVAVLGARGLGLADAVARVPSLAARLHAAEPLDALRGAGPLRQTAAARTAGRVALVGDAAGYVDALTGEGLAVGLAGAREVVRAIAADDLPAYERAWRRVTRTPRLVTEGVVRLATSPLRRTVVPLAAAAPRLFGAAIERLAAPA